MPPSDGLAVVPEDECRKLLASEYTGRLAFVARDGRPLILPVNYRLDERGGIVIRTTDGEKLEAARRDALAAFEIDGLDPEYRRGWSVVVRGILSDITDSDSVAAEATVQLRPWVRGDSRDQWIRLEPDEITSRRILH